MKGEEAVPQGIEKKVLRKEPGNSHCNVGKQELEVLALDGRCSLSAFCSFLGLIEITTMFIIFCA